MRTEFIHFLEALARGQSTLAEWQRFLVNHYPDKELEAVRIDLVRKVVQANSTNPLRPSPLVTSSIPEWIARLRS